MTYTCDSFAVAVAILAAVGSGGATPPDLVDPGGGGSAGGQSPIYAYKIVISEEKMKGRRGHNHKKHSINLAKSPSIQSGPL
jgi:hypothetical protein